MKLIKTGIDVIRFCPITRLLRFLTAESFSLIFDLLQPINNKMRTALLVFIFTLQCFAQGHTSGGGGGAPSGPSSGDETAVLCNKVLHEVESREKTLVEARQKEYQSQKDFFNLIETLFLKKILEHIEMIPYGPAPLLPSCECNNDKILLSILNDYIWAESLNCPFFKDRIQKIEIIKKLIE